jgi:hypothetical protein
MRELTSAENLETVIVGAITRFNNRRVGSLVKVDEAGALIVPDAPRLLRPLFATTEVNLISAGQRSGLHPLAVSQQTGPSAAVEIPNSFFLNADLLAGGNGVRGLGIGAATAFSATVTLTPDEYRQLIDDTDVKIVSARHGALRGDANFAWFTPEASFIDNQWVDLLVQRGAISREFAAAVLAIDLEQPVLSRPRAALLPFIPETYRAVPGEPHPDTLTRAVIARLAASDPPAGSPAAELLALLELEQPVAELEHRVQAYRDRLAERLGDPSTREAELHRLFGLLVERRLSIIADPVLHAPIESGALLPLP